MRPAGSRLSAAPHHQANIALGAVLAGGTSRRFGSDKAAAEFRGRTLLDHALFALRDAGLSRLVYVGGVARDTVPPDVVHLTDEAGVEPCMLRGVVTALEFARQQRHARVMILACDIPLLTAHTVARVLAALDDTATDVEHNTSGADISVAYGEREHWSCIAVRDTALPGLRASLNHGERAMHRATAKLRVVRVVAPGHELTNVNDLAVLNSIAEDPLLHE